MDLLRSWERHLKATNRAPNTILKYQQIGRQFQGWLGTDSEFPELVSVRKRDLEGYIAHVLDGRKASTAATHYQALQQLYKWLVDEEEMDRSPFLKMSPPIVPEQLTPVLSKLEISHLIKSCGDNKRDLAIVRTLLDTGIRLNELVSLTSQEVDLGLDTVTVMGKGRRVRVVPFGDKTATALERWLRVRPSDNSVDRLWLGKKGPLTCSGVRLMLNRKGTHPHALRHTAIHHWLAAGMSETNVMRLAGWRSRSMLMHYAASTGHERAIESHRMLALGNNW